MGVWIYEHCWLDLLCIYTSWKEQSNHSYRLMSWLMLRFWSDLLWNIMQYWSQLKVQCVGFLMLHQHKCNPGFITSVSTEDQKGQTALAISKWNWRCSYIVVNNRLYIKDGQYHHCLLVEAATFLFLFCLFGSRIFTYTKVWSCELGPAEVKTRKEMRPVSAHCLIHATPQF